MTHIVYKLGGRPYITEGYAYDYKHLDIIFMANDRKLALKFYYQELARSVPNVRFDKQART